MPDKLTQTFTQAKPGEESVDLTLRECLDDWIDAINGGNADSINALYAKDAALLATFEPRLLFTPEQRRNYFVVFKTRRKLKAAIDECHIGVLGEDAGMANGLYTFSFIDDNGAPQTVHARFTFVYARQPEGDWLIVAHHSSACPP